MSAPLPTGPALDGPGYTAQYFTQMVRLAQVLLTVVVLLGWSQPARTRAAVSTTVKLRVIKLARQAKRAFLASRYDEALRHWRRAYTLWPKPQLLYNIALAYERSRRPAQAMTFLRAFFAEAKTHPQKRALMRGARKLERSLLPRISVLGLSGPKGAQAFVDGKLVGSLPLEVVLLPGTHRLELRAPGRTTAKRTITLRAGRTTLLDVQMRTAGRRPALRPDPRPGLGHGAHPATSHPRKGLHMAYTLTLAGLALALAGAAVSTGLLAVKRYDEFQANPSLGSRARVKSLQDATNSLWAVAGAAGVAAVVLAIFTRWRAARESPSRPAPTVDIDLGPGGLGVAVRGIF